MFLSVALLSSSPPRDVVIDLEDTKPLLANQVIFDLFSFCVLQLLFLHVNVQ